MARPMKLTPEDKFRALVMINQGMNKTEIAYHLKVSERTLDRALKEEREKHATNQKSELDTRG